MSNWREQLAKEEETAAAIDVLVRYYHYPVLVFLVVFAFWNRVRNYSNFIIDGEIFYAGNDPWYHMRSSEYATQSFLQTMPFDPWTNFPLGTSTGQFGTIFDQIIALLALIVGLGNPDQYTTQFVILVAPALFGVLACIPAYLIGHRLGGRFGGIIGVMFIAFSPDRLLQMSLAGHVQHHSIEVIFMGLSLFGVMVALSVAEREKPVYELLAAGAFDALRGTLGYSMLAGVAIGLYMWAWPPGVWIYGIFGAFFVLFMCLEHVRGRSPEHAAFVGSIAFGTAALMQLAVVRELGFSATGQSLIQPGLGLLVVGGIVFMAWLSRELEARNLTPLFYPATVAGSILAGVVLMAVLTPGLFEYLLNQLQRTLGYVTHDLNPLLSVDEGARGTIGEGTPGDFDDLFDFYRFAAFTAILGGLLVVVRQFLDDDPSGQELLVAVWAAFMFVATFTQIRFAYYMVLVVGALNALLAGYIFDLLGTSSGDEPTLPETYQVLTVAVIVFILFVPMFGLPFVGGGETAVGMANNMSHPGDVTGWSDSLDWMSENTPAPGQYANPDGEPMEYYGEYARTDDFEYPPGAYGVLSWWDYGHWITARGERIPNANPFQHHADEAADVLLAQDEAEALEQLSELDDHDDAQTRYVMVDSLMVETETGVGGKFFAPADFHDEYDRGDFYRHIVGDDNQFLGISQKQAYYDSLMVRLYHYHGSAQEPEMEMENLGSQSFDDIEGIDDLSRTQSQTLVMEWLGTENEFGESGDVFVEAPPLEGDDSLLRFEENLTAAQEAVEGDPSNQIGGIGAHPEERVGALEHFRLVYMDEVPAVPFVATEQGAAAWDRAAGNGLNPFLQRVAIRDASLLAEADNHPYAALDPQQRLQQHLTELTETTPSFTKTFERVPGGTIEGTIDVNETMPDEVTLQVPMVPENGEPFTYTQHVDVDENGEFTATVPYSTTGYDEMGLDEGYTNVSVRADGPYTVYTPSFELDGQQYMYQGTVDVTEEQVVGEDDTPASVTLEQEELPDIDDMLGGDAANGGESDENNEGDENGDEGNENGDESDDGNGDEGDENDDEAGEDGTDEDGGEVDARETVLPSIALAVGP